MPDELDPKTLAEAINFAQDIYSKNGRLPTEKELAKRFPNKEITPEFLTKHLDTSKIRTESPQTAGEILSEEKDNEKEEKEQPHRRNKFLDANRQSNFNQDLKNRVKSILQQSGAKNLDSTKLDQIATEIAQTSTEKLVKQLPEIQDLSQVNRLAADNITQAILVHPELDNTKLKTQKVFENSSRFTQNLAATHQQEIETTAVLKTVGQIRDLKKPNEEARTVVSNTVDEYLQAKAPLTPGYSGQAVKAELNGFVQAYATNFDTTVSGLISSGKTPSFKDLKEIRNSAFNTSVNDYKSKLHEKYKLDPVQLTARLNGNLGLAPLSLEQVELMGLGGATPKAFTFSKATGDFASKGAAFGLNAKQGKMENYLSLLTADPAKFEREYMKAVASVQTFKGKKNLTLSERTEFFKAQKYLGLLATARRFENVSKNKALAYRSMWNAAAPRDTSRGTGLTFATQTVWDTTQAIFQNRYGAGSQNVLAQSNYMHILAERAHGAMAFSFSDFIPDAPKFGMGMPSVGRNQMMVANVGARLMRKIATGIAGITGALALYFLGLGKAAFTGFMIGATAGGAIGVGLGATIGLQIALATGPFAPIVGLVTVPTGAFLGGATGAFVGGVAGGLIAAGLYAGSATMISMGAGAGIGGVIGAYAGFAAGAGAASLIIGACAVFTGGACAFLAPLVPISGAIGASIGAVIGTIVGAATGYVIGKYIISPIQSAVSGLWNGLTGGIGSTGTTIGGAISSVASTATGLLGSLASGFLSGITTVGGGILSGLSAAANFLVGGIGSLSLPFAVVAIPTLGGIGAVVIGGTIVGIVGAASFFSVEGDQISKTGDNAFYTVTKTATPGEIKNEELSKDARFKITLKAKSKKLTAITITDTITSQGKNPTPAITQTTTGTPISPPCASQIPQELAPNQQWECSFDVQITPAFADSVVTNTVNVSATPEGETSATTDSASAFIVVGTPPQDCPHGWPTTSGVINQGPKGATSHLALYDSPSHEVAIDDAVGDGTDVKATFTGTIDHIQQEKVDGYGAYIDIRGTCNGRVFIARWAHLTPNTIDLSLAEGNEVPSGFILGQSGHSGNVTGPHLHYSFFGPELSELGQYLPAVPPETCNSETECNISW